MLSALRVQLRRGTKLAFFGRSASSPGALFHSQEADMIQREDLPSYKDAMNNVIEDTEYVPGVRYVCFDVDDERLPYEVYVVDRGSPAISDEAKRYGIPFPDRPDMLAYDYTDPDSGKCIIEYEAHRYCVRNNIPPLDDLGDAFYDTAVFAMDANPEYFGSVPIPIDTPYGRTTRSRELTNGVAYLETDQGRQLISVSYPIWSVDLITYVVPYGEQTEYDKKHGIDKTCGYLFFEYSTACLALWGLKRAHSELQSSPYIRWPELMNAIWERHSDFAMAHNMRESNGANSIEANLLEPLGFDVERKPTDDVITLTPGVGTDWLAF